MSSPIRDERGVVATAVLDPVGSARVAKRLASFVGLTSKHLRMIPDDAEQEELNQRANDWALKLLPAMGVDLTVKGEQPEPGTLLVANHRSYVDILAMLAATPCCFLAKDDVADWPVLGKAAVRVGTVFVKRDKKDSRTAAREALGELLKAGFTVAVFPEGTTYRGPGCAEFRLGAFMTAHELGAPVVPVAIEYARPEDAWQDEGLVKHFNRKFRRPQIDAEIHLGPSMSAAAPIDLMRACQEWVDGRLREIWDTYRIG